MEGILIQNIIISLTAIFGVITLINTLKQMRFNELSRYYELIERIRTSSNELYFKKFTKGNKQKFADSIFKQKLDLYETISYMVLCNNVDEKDAFNMLNEEFKDFYKKCKNAKISLKKQKYFVQLIKRWKNNLNEYKVNQKREFILYFLITIVVLSLVIILSYSNMNSLELLVSSMWQGIGYSFGILLGIDLYFVHLVSVVQYFLFLFL